MVLIMCCYSASFFHLFDWSISFQLLISGSLDSLDVDDLRTHTTYSSGYHKVSSSNPFFLCMFFFVCLFVFVSIFSSLNKLQFLIKKKHFTTLVQSELRCQVN